MEKNNCQYLREGECYSPNNGDPRKMEPVTCREKNSSTCIYRSPKAYSEYLDEEIRKHLREPNRNQRGNVRSQYDMSEDRKVARSLRQRLS